MTGTSTRHLASGPGAMTRADQPGSDEHGQILVLTLLVLPVLLGILALSIDASFMYDKRNRLGAAADAAAKAAALEIHRGNTTPANLQAFAQQAVAAHGFSPGQATTVVLNAPPATGPFAGRLGYAEAIVSERTSTLFAKVLGSLSMTPTNRAVAGEMAPFYCLTALGGTNPTLDIGTTSITLDGCSTAVGGNLKGSNPNSEVTGTPVPNVDVTGICTGTCDKMGVLTTGATAAADPIANLVAPNVAGVCKDVLASQTALTEGCYNSIPNTVTNLGPGIYKVTGPVNIGRLSGTGVMLYLTGSGQLVSNNNKALTLTAPTSGSYAGVAIFQDRSDALSFQTGQNFTLSVDGAIYMPSAAIIMKNSLSLATTGCTVIVAKTIEIGNGNGSLNTADCAAKYPGAAYLSVAIAE